MIFTTLWLYLKTLIKPNHIHLYYGVISVSYYAMTSFSALLFGRVVDRSRKMWLFCQVMNIFIILGNIIYSLPLSPYCLLIGRALAGIGGSMRSIAMGEIGRIYNKEERSSKFTILFIAFSVGVVVGPAANLAFVDVDFQIYGLRVTYANVPGLYMAVIFLINQIVSFIFISDLSKSKTLSEMLAMEKRASVNRNVISEQECMNDHSSSSYKSFDKSFDRYINMEDNATDISTKKDRESETLVRNVDSVPALKTIFCKFVLTTDGFLILTCAFFFDYVLFSCEMWIPMIIVDELGWGIKEVNAVYFVIGILVTIQMFVYLVKQFSQKTLYCIYVSNISFMLVILNVIILLKMHQTDTTGKIVLLVAYAMFFAYDMLMDIFLVNTSSLMAPPSCQSFVQALRMFCQRAGVATALLTAGIVYPWIHIIVPISMGTTGIILLGVVLRRKKLVNPHPLF